MPAIIPTDLGRADTALGPPAAVARRLEPPAAAPDAVAPLGVFLPRLPHAGGGCLLHGHAGRLSGLVRRLHDVARRSRPRLWVAVGGLRLHGAPLYRQHRTHRRSVHAKRQIASQGLPFTRCEAEGDTVRQVGYSRCRGAAAAGGQRREAGVRPAARGSLRQDACVSFAATRCAAGPTTVRAATGSSAPAVAARGAICASSERRARPPRLAAV